jgi:hypothetical protein
VIEVGQIDDEEEDSEEEMEEQTKDKKEPVKSKTKKGETQNRVPKKRLFEVFQKTFSEIHEVHNLKTKTVEIK